jgi:hypothetical protein
MNTLLRRNILPLYINSARLTLRSFSDATKKDEIDKIVKNSKVVVFMKGVPDAPRCGFSNAVVQIMRMHAVPYDSHDVLADETIRQGKFVKICKHYVVAL